MSVEAVKLFRPQQGDIVIVDFNKVNITQVENALKDAKIPVIAVHDINTIQIWGMREQKDFSQENADLILKLDAAQKENNRLQRIIKDDMVPKVNPVQTVQTTSPVPTTPIRNVGEHVVTSVPATSTMPTPTKMVITT